MTRRHALLSCSRADLRASTLGLACFSALGLALSVPCFFSPLFDDAYIHARSAEQLLRTGSPGFNPGLSLKTDSSTGYLLLLSALSWICGNTLVALRVIQALSVVLFVTRLCTLARTAHERFSLGQAAWIGLALPPVLWAAYGGMETASAAVCLVLCASASLRERHGAALFYASLAACLRLELLVLLVCYLAWWFGSGRRAVRALGACAPLLACFLFDALHYRSILPHAAVAKSIAYDLPFQDAARLAISVGFERYMLLLAPLQVAYFTLSLGSLLARVRARSPLLLSDALALQAAALLAVWAVGRSIVFPWYVATFSVCLSLCGLLESGDATTPRRHEEEESLHKSSSSDRGAVASWRPHSSSRRLSEPSRLMRARRIVLSALQIVLACLAASAVRIELGWAADELPSGVRAQRYLELARGLYAHCPTCSLASSEIGGLGYGFRGTTYDALGLSDRDATSFHPLSVPTQRASHRVGAIPPGYIALRDPDFVVSMPIFSEAFRRSTTQRVYTIYDCPLVPAEPARRLWGDAIVQVFSKRVLPARVLERVKCRTNTHGD